MQGWSLWTGLARSALIADVTPADRDPARLLAVIAGGLGIGFVAAMAAWMLIMAPYTLASGQGAQGLAGLNAAARDMVDLRLATLPLTLLRMTMASLTDGVFLLAFVAVAAALSRRTLKAYWTMAAHIRWRLLAAGLALAAVAMAPVVAGQRLLDPEGPLPMLAADPHLYGRLLYAASTLLLIPAAAMEELFFRGWLLRQIAAFSRRPSALIGVTALIFSGLHLDFSFDGFITRALMGAGFAYMTLRLGGMEFAAGAHAANNMLIVLFLEPLTTAATPDSGYSWGSLIGQGLLIGGYVLITEAVARIPSLRRLAGVRAEEISPAPPELAVR